VSAKPPRKAPNIRSARRLRRFAAQELLEHTQNGRTREKIAAARALVQLAQQIEVDEARRKSKGPETLTEGTLADYLETKLVEVRCDLDAARAAGSHQAVAGFNRTEIKLRIQLQEERERNDPLEGLTPEQFCERLRIELREWPDDYLRLAIGEYETRHRMRMQPLRIIEGGE